MLSGCPVSNRMEREHCRALVDRLVHHAEVIVMRGESYRLKGKQRELLEGEGRS
jgi:DNA replication protein DnaC